ncbi:MAG: hypothetical protein IKF99_18145 [Oscillospiraceae bacterium]|nr:hypothetical protein [Oscillospiraceae bacterium]
MKAIKNKLQSKRGASITFALLLFLVCSVVSIVVVVAGSAAAGRMSQRAETDQRYYAVTSAVELLCDDFKGKTVTVEYVKEVSATTVADSVISVTGGNDADNTPLTIANFAILEDASKKLVSKIANGTGNTGTEDKTLTLSATGPDKSSLDCTIKEYVKSDGRVIFEVSNTVGTGKTKPVYTLQVVFEANISASSSQYTQGGKTMEKTVTTLVWSLNSIKKGTVLS